MDHQRRPHRNRFKLIKTLLSSGLLFSLLFFAPPAKADATCEMVNEPRPADMQKYIVTVLEEEIGQPGTTDITYSLICFRQSELIDNKWESTFVTKCKPPSETVKCQRIQIILAETGASLLYGYIALIYKWAAGVIGVVSVLYLIWGGITIATAGDDTGKIGKAKEKIFQSIAGLILLFLSAVILYTINPNFFTI